MNKTYKKIAIPKFRNRISPVFDMSGILVVITDNEILKSELIEFNVDSFEDRIIFLKNLEIELILCSGISEEFAYMLRNEGIEVVDGYTGNPQNQAQRFLYGRGPGGNRRRGNKRGFKKNCDIYDN
jgi:predicted Fe-Mo cluster-binding NifX family protein